MALQNVEIGGNALVYLILIILISVEIGTPCGLGCQVPALIIVILGFLASLGFLARMR